jgi:hypothetical protein
VHHTDPDAGFRTRVREWLEQNLAGESAALGFSQRHAVTVGHLVRHAGAVVRCGGGGKSVVAPVTKLRATSVSRWLLVRA